jgi:chorismate mutase
MKVIDGRHVVLEKLLTQLLEERIHLRERVTAEKSRQHRNSFVVTKQERMLLVKREISNQIAKQLQENGAFLNISLVNELK